MILCPLSISVCCLCLYPLLYIPFMFNGISCKPFLSLSLSYSLSCSPVCFYLLHYVSIYKKIKQQQRKKKKKKLVSESESHGRAKSGWFQIYIAKAQTIQAIIFFYVLFYILTVYSTQESNGIFLSFFFFFDLFYFGCCCCCCCCWFKELSNSIALYLMFWG